MRVVFTAGGGGHFAPVLAVIAALPQDCTYQIIGRKYTYEGSDTISLEYLTAQKNHLPFAPITTGRLQRTFSKYTLSSLLKVPVGYFQAMKILRSYKPDVVISFGGYVSVPVVVAAHRLGIPIILHEQTQQVGLANKISSKFAQTICISWQESQSYFPKNKIILTGNPVNPALIHELETKQQAESTFPSMLITGGSQGSHRINLLVKEALPELLTHATVFHQTGDARQFNDFTMLTEYAKTLPVELQNRYQLQKFIEPEQMIPLVAAASLVVSRAGINTITELLLMRKSALVIPLLDGQTNEQSKNAALYARSGLGETIDEERTNGKQFAEKILSMLEKRDTYRIQKPMPEFDLHINAAQQIIDQIYYVGNQKKNKKS